MAMIEPVIRPPAEAESFLLQVTTGCSSNGCTFCGAYQDKPFRVKPQEEIFADIGEGRRAFPDARRVFLLDGDALAVKNERLVPVLEETGRAFPRLARIASYANGYNITQRSDGQLRELARRKLTLIYVGLESGCQEVLSACRKRATAQEMIGAVQRAAAVGIKSSVIVLLGLGGRRHSDAHVRGTIDALNRMQPRYLSFLTLMLIPGTPLYAAARKKEFEVLKRAELLGEARAIIAGLQLQKTIFRSDHASNYLPLEGRFPQDKDKLLRLFDAALHGDLGLRPEFLRGL